VINLKQETEILQLVENQHNTSSIDLDIGLIFEYIDYKFLLNFSNVKFFTDFSIELGDNIRYLPNIFTQVVGYKFINNETGYLFVYIHNNILIIPGYLIIYFYYEYPVLNYKLNIINDFILDDRNRDIINLYKENYFFKILYSTKNIKFDNKFNKFNYICLIMLYNRKTLFDYQLKFIKDYKAALTPKFKYLNHEDKKIIIDDYNEYKTKGLSIEKIKLETEFSQKYYFLKAQKYKRKYLNLKNLIF
jgi:hypothetical protein